MSIIDIAKAVSIDAKHKIIGIRPGEKIHEQMFGIEDAQYAYEYDEYYKILPSINYFSSNSDRIYDGKKVENDFVYSSANNREWMSVDELRDWIQENINNIGVEFNKVVKETVLITGGSGLLAVNWARCIKNIMSFLACTKE